MSRLIRSLEHVSQALHEAHVTWAIGGSVVLKEYGLPNDVAPNDLDLIIALPDAAASHAALQALGPWERGEPKPPLLHPPFLQLSHRGL